MKEPVDRSHVTRALESISPARLGYRLRLVRVGLGLTQEQVAARADLSVAFLSLLETGRRRPSGDALDKLATALRLHATDLLARRTERAPFESWVAMHAVAVATAAWLDEPEDPRQFALLITAVERWESTGTGPREAEPS